MNNMLGNVLGMNELVSEKPPINIPLSQLLQEINFLRQKFVTRSNHNGDYSPEEGENRGLEPSGISTDYDAVGALDESDVNVESLGVEEAAEQVR